MVTSFSLIVIMDHLKLDEEVENNELNVNIAAQDKQVRLKNMFLSTRPTQTDESSIDELHL
jgi:hypothetical protein